MPYPQFDRRQVLFKPLTLRPNKKAIDRDQIDPAQTPRPLVESEQMVFTDMVQRIAMARKNKRPVMLTFGAHTIKNGLAPVLIRLIERGWITHLATNGAGIIHDWEFAFQGASSEDVRGNVARGEFGNWQETGFNLNLALNLGAFEGCGYGESVGRMIAREGLHIPTLAELDRLLTSPLPDTPEAFEHRAAAADCRAIIQRFALKPGWLAIPHPWKSRSIQARAFELSIPFTGHPMFGHDIIYNHPMNHGASIGRAAERDFLSFAESVARIEGGVYLSVGSAVMSPMIFEKSFSMAQNVALQKNAKPIRDLLIVTVDLAESGWDWTRGEPPENDPAYYQRYNKSFSRMGGTLRTLSMDNRDFLLHLAQRLNQPGN
jgi:hypothetical protein